MRSSLFAVVVVFVVSSFACATPKGDGITRVSAPWTYGEGKREAPVSVEAALSDGKAHLTLTFEGAGRGVAVDVSGVDGLTVTSQGSLAGESVVSPGEARSYDVTFTRGAGRSHLVVSVRGTFNGAPVARVITFALGEGPLSQEGTKITTTDGQTVKVMPAEVK